MVDSKKVNLSRQVPLDIARGLSVLFMILIHTQDYFLNKDLANPVFVLVIDFLGGIPAAPVFMFLMGVGWVYSKRSTPAVLIKRGLKLLVAGYSLSLMRGALPSLLNLVTTGDAFYAMDALQKLLFVDILQFSGLAMICFAGIKKVNLGPRAIAGIALLIMALNALLAYGFGVVTFDFGFVPNAISPLIFGHLGGLIYGANDFSFFPLLTWMIYPYALVRSKNLGRFYLLSGALGALVFWGGTFIVDYLLEAENQLYSYSGYYHHQFQENLIATGFVALFICLCYFLNHILPSPIKKTITRWSANVTDIYFIHWVILGWLVTFMGYNTLSTPYYLALVILVMWISDTMALKKG